MTGKDKLSLALVEEYLADLERERGSIPPLLQLAADNALRIRHSRIRKQKSAKVKTG
ncbi:MAG TPA: hypothetical protein VGZ00_01250 [Candidatus Baltobacteraceae bacterium]|jgi:hypothetical protein|nr:hypothetical protein [Candidatus Baltobacteraceae bacterium]